MLNYEVIISRIDPINRVYNVENIKTISTEKPLPKEVLKSKYVKFYSTGKTVKYIIQRTINQI